MVGGVKDNELLISGENSILAKAEKKVGREGAVNNLDEFQVGIMLERVDLVDNTEELIKAISDERIDFYSIGTNDLALSVMEKELNRKLDREKASDREYFRLRHEVLQRITKILETIRNVNRKRISEGR